MATWTGPTGGGSGVRPQVGRQRQETRGGAGAKGALQGKAILIVDDDARFRGALSRLFEALGAEAVVAGTVDEAAARMMEREWAAVFVDLVFNGEPRGLELCTALQAQQYTGCIYLMSAYYESEFWSRAQTLGCTELLKKPLGSDGLDRIVRRLCSLPGADEK